MLIVLVCCTAYLAIEAKAAPVIISEIEVTRPLSQFRHLPPVGPAAQGKGTVIPPRDITAGVIDPQTANATILSLRRRGDVKERLARSRLRRYALHSRYNTLHHVCGHWAGQVPRITVRYVSKWGRRNLTYKVAKYPVTMTKATVDREIGRALALWSEYTDLSFTPSNGTADIEVRFERGSHGDGRPFDGSRGVILAHAFYPWFGGDVHFDADEDWTVDTSRGTNLFQVAAHEFGHSLGLRHSAIKFAVMTPVYKAYDPDFVLDKDDIEGIQAIYGPRTVDEVPQLCGGPQIDAIFKSRGGDVFAFRGKYYWKLEAAGIAAGYPKLIGTRWSRLPGNIDAAVTHASGKSFFFKGSKYWRYLGDQMDGNYPSEIDAGFSRTPKNVLALLKASIKTNRLRSSSAMRIRCATYNANLQ